MGGSAHEWDAVLDNDLVGGSTLEVRLVMTKFGPPAVEIAYSVDVEPN